MASAVVAERLRADVERHLVAVAGVVADAAHLGELPAGAEVAGAHLRVGLEAAAREHDRIAGQGLPAVRRAHGDAVHPSGVVLLQSHRGVVVPHVDAALDGDLEELVGEALPAPDGLQTEAAPETELPFHLERLVRPRRHEADALLVHPLHGGERLPDEGVGHLLVGEAFRDAHEVLEVLGLGVGADLHHVELGLGEVRHELHDLVDALVGEADGAAGEVGVAAAHRLRGLLEDDDAPPGLAGGERGAEGGVARADNDDVCCVCVCRAHGGLG